MNLEEALDEETLVDVNEAIAELSAHGFQAFYGGGSLMVVADNPMDFASIVCNVYRDNTVRAADVMKWLGY